MVNFLEASFLKSLIHPLFVLMVVSAMLYLNALLFKKVSFFISKERENLRKGFISLFIILIGAIFFIFSLPISTELKGQILSLFGIVLSAGIALSSTSLLGNLLAGIMNNYESRFKSGDLIEVSSIKGRVTKRSLFYTEIQLEDSNFTTIPNLYLATNPIKNTRKNDTVISTVVSLGYDIPRDLVEKTLKNAAKSAGLKDPYVYIVELGDFSIVYKIHGFLEDTETYFSTKHYLNKKVLDALHNKEIEIVSPTFMNQRQVNDQIFIAKTSSNTPKDDSHEEQVFDKAKSYEELEEQKAKLEQALEKSEDKITKEQIKEGLKELSKEKEKLDKKKEDEI